MYKLLPARTRMTEPGLARTPCSAGEAAGRAEEAW